MYLGSVDFISDLVSVKIPRHMTAKVPGKEWYRVLASDCSVAKTVPCQLWCMWCQAAASTHKQLNIKSSIVAASNC